MSAKQKMAIAITALCLVAVVAIVTVIAVFAANTQTFTSSVTVSYTVDDVQCKVSAKYYTGEGLTGEGVSMKDPSTQVTELEYEVGSAAPKQGTTLAPESEIKLSSSAKVIVFEYIFENTSDEHAFTAELQYTGTAKNMIVKTKEDGAALTPSSDFEEDTEFTNTKSVSDTSGNFTTEEAINVAASATVHVYVRVEIKEVSKDAGFAGGFQWTLKKASV